VDVTPGQPGPDRERDLPLSDEQRIEHMARFLHAQLRNGKDIPYADGEERAHYHRIVTNWLRELVPAPPAEADEWSVLERATAEENPPEGWCCHAGALASPSPCPWHAPSAVPAVDQPELEETEWGFRRRTASLAESKRLHHGYGGTEPELTPEEVEVIQAETPRILAETAEQMYRAEAERDRLREFLKQLALDIHGRHANPAAQDLADTIHGRICAVLGGDDV
jgi:hypothetical protein